MPAKSLVIPAKLALMSKISKNEYRLCTKILRTGLMNEICPVPPWTARTEIRKSEKIPYVCILWTKSVILIWLKANIVYIWTNTHKTHFHTYKPENIESLRQKVSLNSHNLCYPTDLRDHFRWFDLTWIIIPGMRPKVGG